jgi:hypothetical protein
MAEETPLEVTSSFGSTLQDETGQRNLTIDSSRNHELIWTLANNQDTNLVIQPFGNTKVDQNQFHFKFDFSPGALTTAPAVSPGWNVFPVTENGVIKYLYLALAGGDALTLKPGETKKTVFTYANAIQKNNSSITVYVITGQNVTIGNNKMITLDLNLIHENAPTLSAPPFAVDFVGRRTLLNDGLTENDFTFALTNMMHTDIQITPTSVLSVWFDAAPNEATQGYEWAVAKLQDLASPDFKLIKPSDDWTITAPLASTKEVIVNSRWLITVVKPVILKPQQPVFFKFTKLKTSLAPGIARMYLSFSKVENYRPGVLIGELEKSPLLYGPTHGNGLYLSAGVPQLKTLPALTFDSGLNVQQFGKGAAAVFNGGNVGIGTGTTAPAAKLHIQDTAQNTDGGSLIIGSSDPNVPSLRFGFQPGYAWIQSHAGKPLAINPTLRNVGIGTPTPGSALSVAGGVAIGQSYAQQNSATIAANNLAVEGKIGAHQPNPGSALSVDGGVAIGASYSQANTTIGNNNLAVEGKASVNTTTPSALLQVSDTKLKEKIFGNTTSVGIVQQANEKVALSLRKFEDNAVLEFRVYDKTGAKEFGNFIQADKATGDLLIGDTGKVRAARGGWLGLGDGVEGRQVDAGKIGYKLFSDGLDIVGASNPPVNNVTPPRKVRVFDQLQTGSLALTGGATINGDNKQVLEFGANVPNRIAASGQIGYKVYSEGLDIVGATSNLNNRQIHLWDEVYIHGNFWRVSNGFWVYLEPHNPVNSGSWDYAVFRYSDLQLKSNVTQIPSAIDKVKQLRGCSFVWSDDALKHFTAHIDKLEPADPNQKPEEIEKLREAERQRQLAFLKKPQVGLIAQEVAAVLPEAVTTEKDGFQSVNYNHVIALLVEAIKEQQEQIEQLKQAVAKKA